MTRPAPGDRVRVGLVGIGLHGRRYANHIRRDVPGLELASIFQRDAKSRARVAHELGVVPAADLDALLDAVEAVIIVTPPPSHAALIARALERELYVLVEKPVTMRAEEATPLLEADRRLGGRVMVAHTLRYDPVIAGVRARLGEVAPIRYVRMAQRLQPSPLRWQHDGSLEGRGSILLTGVHLFDTVSWLLGEPMNIRSCIRRRVLNEVNEDFFLAAGESASGAVVSMEVSKYTTHRACSIEVVGEGGQLLGDYQRHTLFVGDAGERRPVAGIEAVPTVRAALAAFEKFVRGETANPIPLADGVRAVALADRCYEAAGA